MFVAVPSTVQVLAGRLRLVVPRTLNTTLFVFVKVSWNTPLLSRVEVLITGGVGGCWVAAW
jgi:hypothetical protein